ncbi:hypothetical protein EK904_009876 [Melospiza melodia maxima]|nr:hypothetical protein EK904_009876 [Melospiza melodia maxima]
MQIVSFRQRVIVCGVFTIKIKPGRSCSVQREKQTLTAGPEAKAAASEPSRGRQSIGGGWEAAALLLVHPEDDPCCSLAAGGSGGQDAQHCTMGICFPFSSSATPQLDFGNSLPRCTLSFCSEAHDSLRPDQEALIHMLRLKHNHTQVEKDMRPSRTPVPQWCMMEIRGWLERMKENQKLEGGRCVYLEEGQRSLMANFGGLKTSKRYPTTPATCYIYMTEAGRFFTVSLKVNGFSTTINPLLLPSATLNQIDNLESTACLRSDCNTDQGREELLLLVSMSPFIPLRKALERNLLGWNKKPDLTISSTVSEALHRPKRLGRELLTTWLRTKIKRHLPFISCDMKLMQCFRERDDCIPNCLFEMILGLLRGCVHSPPLEKRLDNPTC